MMWLSQSLSRFPLLASIASGVRGLFAGGPADRFEQLNDEDLVAEAAKGGTVGKRAFSILMRRHQSWLVRLLTMLLGDQSEAEDVAQEAFLRAFLALKRYRTDPGFRPWVRVIATRLAFNRRRAASRRQRYTEELQRLRDADAATHQHDDAVADRDAVIQVLPRLAYPYREILLLRYVEELSLQEIAQTLDLGLSAAKMRLSRARDQFLAHYHRAAGGEHATADGS